MPRLRNPNGPYWQALEAAERKIIWDTLAITGGDVKGAARLLDIARNYLRTRCNQLGIDPQILRAHAVGGKKKPAADVTPAATSWLLAGSKDPAP